MGWICSFVEPRPSIVVTSVPLTSRRMEDYLEGMDLILCRAQPFYCGDICPTDQQEAGGLPGWGGYAPL
jgi:hypothetical protein